MLAAGLAAFVVYGVAGGGCYAQRLPAPLTLAEARLLREPPLPYTVVVTLWDSAAAAHYRVDPEAYAAGALRYLRGSRAFATVRAGTRTDSAADFFATSIASYCSTAALPILTGLSLGLIPTIFTDTHCAGALLRPARKRAGFADSTIVRHTTTGRVVMGWVAVFVGALPGWTHGEARDARLSTDHARLEILRALGPGPVGTAP